MVALLALLAACGGETEIGQTRYQQAGEVVPLCWQGCLYVTAPGLIVSGEQTPGCFWSSASEQACVELELPADGVVAYRIGPLGSCPESCEP